MHRADICREGNAETLFSLFACSPDIDKDAVITLGLGRPQITKLGVQMCPLAFSLPIFFIDTNENSGEITLE